MSIPCAPVPPLELGFLRLHPFGLLAASGVIAAHRLAVREAARRGLSADLAGRLGLVMALAGFAGAWLFRAAYQPGMPRGIASFGGIFGGLIGAWLYARRHRAEMELLPYLDSFAVQFPIGWILGRAGCVLVHDHLGQRGSGWFTVDCGGGSRYDLALIELVFLAAIALPLQGIARRPQPSGLTLGRFLLLYGLFRYLLDRLHEDPPQWLSWPVDGWCGCLAAVLGLWLLRKQLLRSGARAEINST